MSTNVTSKGQVTIPKPLRDQFGIKPGTQVEFKIGPDGNLTLTKAGATAPPGRFAAMRGRVKLGMSTDEIMALLRGGEDD